MSSSILKPGDIVAFQYQTEKGKNERFLFEISRVVWGDIGVRADFCPQPKITGKLQDAGFLKNAPSSDEALFGGSGFGGSLLSPNLIATGQTAVFYSSGLGKVQSPPITYFSFFRKDEDGHYRPIEPNQLDAAAGKENAEHRERRNRTQTLMKLLGFDLQSIFDCSQSSASQIPALHYYDGRYRAEYKVGMATGNRLAVFDTETQKWIMCKYYNSYNEDMLQIAVADLSKGNADNTLRYGLAEEPSIHTSGAAITTFTSSERFGVQAVNYLPSKSEAEECLRIPSHSGSGSIFAPNIQLWPDGTIVIPQEYPLKIVEEEHPGLFERIHSMVSFSTAHDGTIQLHLGDKTIQLKSPDSELNELINNLSKTKKQQGLENK